MNVLRRDNTPITGESIKMTNRFSLLTTSDNGYSVYQFTLYLYMYICTTLYDINKDITYDPPTY